MTSRPVRLLSTLALAGAVKELTPLYEARTAAKVEAEFAPTKILVERLRAGEPADLAILTEDAASALAAAGEVVNGGRTDLAVALVGVAVADGAPLPAMDTVEAFVAALHAAHSIVYSLNGASGLHFAQVIERLGLSDMISAKATVIPQGLTGEVLLAGGAAMAVQQLSELRAAGALNVVPLPDALQARTLFSAVVLERGADRDGAQALARFLASDQATAAFALWGLQPPPGRNSRPDVADRFHAESPQ